MPIRNIIRLNVLLVLAVGIYGFLTDEPYWKAVGHGPNLYDYVFWFALALNGPSGFAAEYAAWFATSNGSDHDLQFVLQYGFWLLLLWVQWRLYDAAARYCIGHRSRETLLYLAAFAVAVLGGLAAYQGWVWGHRPMDVGFIDRYFWFVRIGGVALSGVVVFAHTQLVKASRALPNEALKT